MALTVLQPGPLLTIQDSGRVGQQRWGVPNGGALDPLALVLANRLVGNAAAAAGLEITAGMCRLRAQRSTVAALLGGQFGAQLDGWSVPLGRAFLWRSGQELHIGARISGARAYLALAGGIAVPAYLGSRSTLLGGPLPGLAGRPLRAGDQLPLGVGQLSWAGAQLAALPCYALDAPLRYLPGPHQHLFDTPQLLDQARWRVSPHSSRMGYRLDGPPLTGAATEIASLGVVPGVIQVPPSGQPIVLLADAQTTGGYPIIGVVIAADLPRLAQLLPGDQLSFQPATLALAQAAASAQQQLLQLSLHEQHFPAAPV